MTEPTTPTREEDLLTKIAEMLKGDRKPKNEPSEVDDSAAITKAAIDELVKSNQETQKQLEDVRKQLEREREALEAERAAREELTKAREEDERKRVLKSFVSKAATYQTIVSDPTTIGAILFKCSQALDEDEYNALEKMLEDADRLIAKSDVWMERGTSVVIDEATGFTAKVEKIANEKGISFADAILELPRSEQIQYLKERRGN